MLMGSGNTPITLAINALAHELKVPLIGLVPINVPGEAGSWAISIPQPADLLVSTVADHMKADGAKTVGYIGFSDALGGFGLRRTGKIGTCRRLKIVTNERYARADTSVTAQALHIVAAAPDAC